MNDRHGPVGVAIIGAGTISNEYLRNLTSFPDLTVHVVADVVEGRARSQAERYGVRGWGGVEAALGHPDVEIVANLTIPSSHVEVSRAIIESGRHVWTEKPLATDREGGRALLELARRHGVRLGSATDTFLGRGLQSAQRAIQRGDIGEPLSAVTMMQESGPESWHQGPEFIYAAGAGPLWDRGPYYLSALVQLLGPMRRVAGLATKAWDERPVRVGPRAGTTFPVEMPTNVQVITEFENGRIAQSTYSYESPLMRLGFVEISGTEATLAVPDPNFFDGDMYLYPTRYWSVEDQLAATRGEAVPKSEWTAMPTGEWTATRGIGLLELARSLRAGTPHMASAEFGYHVLDAMVAISESAERRSFVEIESTLPPVPPLPEGWDPYAATL